MLKGFCLFLARWLLYTALGVITLFTDPFGLSSTTDRASADVIYRITAPFYQSDAREAITLVLIDGLDVAELHEQRILQTNEWPLRYSDWRSVLRAIDRFEPSAVFLDVLFERERATDPSLPSLLNYLERTASTRPLYIAGDEPPYTEPLQRQLAQYASLVGTGWQGGYDGVPLTQSGKPMAALSLYRDHCKGSGAKGCRENTDWTQQQEPMPHLSVRWGSEPRLRLSAELQGFSAETFCTNASGGAMATIQLFFRSLLNGVVEAPGQTNEAPCLYHRAVSLQNLFHIIDQGTERERAALRESLEDRLVLVGTFFDGLPDRVDTPVLGQVPGVALHAMMLDNLMTYGSGYLRQPRANHGYLNAAAWGGIVLLLMIWVHLAERARPDGQPAFQGKHALSFLGGAFLLIGLFALFLVFEKRLEPVNALGFLGLAELTRRIHVGWEKELFNQLLAWLQTIRSWM